MLKKKTGVIAPIFEYRKTHTASLPLVGLLDEAAIAEKSAAEQPPDKTIKI